MNHGNALRELDLTSHRADESIWNRPGWNGTRQRPTFGRWLVAVGGGALAVQGLRQRSLRGMTLAGLGGALAWWALSGEGDLSDARRWLGRLIEQFPWRGPDRIHEASADSFPASDAPSWTPTTGAGPHGVAH